MCRHRLWFLKQKTRGFFTEKSPSSTQTHKLKITAEDLIGFTGVRGNKGQGVWNGSYWMWLVYSLRPTQINLGFFDRIEFWEFPSDSPEFPSKQNQLIWLWLNAQEVLAVTLAVRYNQLNQTKPSVRKTLTEWTQSEEKESNLSPLQVAVTIRGGETRSEACQDRAAAEKQRSEPSNVKAAGVWLTKYFILPIGVLRVKCYSAHVFFFYLTIHSQRCSEQLLGGDGEKCWANEMIWCSAAWCGVHGHGGCLLEDSSRKHEAGGPTPAAIFK